jgi:uncharacterized protein (TIGR02246 family)
MINEAKVLGLFKKWNMAIQSGNPDEVVKLYADDAILVPTLSNKIRHNNKEIRDYFVQFLALNPVGKILEHNIRIYNDIAINSGIYSFEINKNNSRTEVKARFSYVYKKFTNSWLIIEHHSSLLPE